MKDSILRFWVALIFCAGICTGIYSCKKHEKKVNNGHRLSTLSDGTEHVFHINDQAATTVPKTVLGDAYTCPFRVDIIQQAWNNLSENDITNLQPTHQYVKFTPQTVEQLAELTESGLRLFDFPLDRQVMQMGFRLDGATDEQIPELYTLVRAADAIPDVPHTIQYGVYLTQIESIITEEAFRLADLEDMYPYERDDPNQVFDELPQTIETMAKPKMWGDEELNQPLTRYDGGPGGYNGGVGLNFQTPTPNDVHDCNCERNGDDREPSGCVLVEETQFAPFWQGVRNVTVELVGPFMQLQVLFTNQQGCFRSGTKMRYHSPLGDLPVYCKVHFEGGDAKVRSLVPGSIFNIVAAATVPVDNVAPWGLNNISINIHRSINAAAWSTAAYFAATTNNAHYEHTDMCWQDGILPMYSGMNYLINHTGGGAVCLMQKQLKNAGTGSPVNNGFMLLGFNHIPAIAGGVGPYLLACPPDIVIGSHLGNIYDVYSSDRLRETIYHEMGHAVHYRRAGGQFWLDLIAYESQQSVNSFPNSDPYGDGTHVDAGRCALAEMWGNHIGYTYANRRYGRFHSRNVDPITNSWFALIEAFAGLPSNPWIPIGLPHDLLDNNMDNQNFTFNGQPAPIDDAMIMGPTGAGDNVGGFTNLRLYNELGANCQSIQQWVINVRNNQLAATGNTLIDYNTLVGLYGL